MHLHKKHKTQAFSWSSNNHHRTNGYPENYCYKNYLNLFKKKFCVIVAMCELIFISFFFAIIFAFRHIIGLNSFIVALCQKANMIAKKETKKVYS